MKYQVLIGFLKQRLILKMPSAAFTLESVLNRKERGKRLNDKLVFKEMPHSQITHQPATSQSDLYS